MSSEGAMKHGGIILLLVAAVAVALAFPSGLRAWDESPKTLKEKADRDAERERIASAGVKRKIAYKCEVAAGKATERRIMVVTEDYDRKGRTTAIETYYGFSLKNRIEFSYDASGNMAGGTQLSPKNEVEEKASFVYDGQGRMLSAEYLDATGAVKESFTYKRSEDNRSIFAVRFKGRTVLVSRALFSYTADLDRSDCRLIERTTDQGTLALTTELYYRADGKLSDQIVLGTGMKELYRFSYEYDKGGNNTRITKTGPDGAAEWTEKFIYYKKGICLERQKYNSKNELESVMKFEYEYFQGDEKK